MSSKNFVQPLAKASDHSFSVQSLLSVNHEMKDEAWTCNAIEQEMDEGDENYKTVKQEIDDDFCADYAVNKEEDVTNINGMVKHEIVGHFETYNAVEQDVIGKYSPYITFKPEIDEDFCSYNAVNKDHNATGTFSIVKHEVDHDAETYRTHKQDVDGKVTTYNTIEQVMDRNVSPSENDQPNGLPSISVKKETLHHDVSTDSKNRNGCTVQHDVYMKEEHIESVIEPHGLQYHHTKRKEKAVSEDKDANMPPVKKLASQKRLECADCGKKTASMSNLKKHRRLHTSEQPYECRVCGHKSKHSSAMKMHMRRRHTGEKPYQCNMCHYKTACSGALKRHMRTHTGEQPYECSLCDYRTADASSLNRHVRLVHVRARFECSTCHYKTCYKSHLIRHIKANGPTDHTVEIPPQNKEKHRRYREKMKQDPDKYNEYRRKKRENYHAKKILAKDMTPNDLKQARIIWNLRKKSQKERTQNLSRLLANTPSFPLGTRQANKPELKDRNEFKH